MKIGNKQTAFFTQGQGAISQGNLSPILFNLYINELADQLEISTAPGLTLSVGSNTLQK